MGKRENTKEEKESILKRIIDKKEIIVELSGGLVILYSMIDFIYNVLYQLKCEEFYGIPGEYFHFNIDNKILYFGLTILLVVICMGPAILKKYDEKKGGATKGSVVYASFFATIVGMEFGLFNVYNLIEIMKQTYKTSNFFRCINDFLNKNAMITIVVVIILGSIALLGITLIDEIKSIKWKWCRTIVNILFMISFVSSLMLLIYGTMYKMSITIENKTKYEFVTLEDKECVILSEHDGKLLVSPFDIDDNGKCVFITNDYWFCEKYEGTFQYIDLGYCPEIIK